MEYKFFLQNMLEVVGMISLVAATSAQLVVMLLILAARVDGEMSFF